MKKILILSVLLLLTTATANARIADERIALGGIYVGQSASEVDAIYGKPGDISRSKANAAVMYYNYRNNGTNFHISFRDNIVTDVNVEGNNGIATPDGIKVGTPKEEVLKILGTPDKYDKGTQVPDSAYLAYNRASGKYGNLDIEIRYGKVFRIAIF